MTDRWVIFRSEHEGYEDLLDKRGYCNSKIHHRNKISEIRAIRVQIHYADQVVYKDWSDDRNGIERLAAHSRIAGQLRRSPGWAWTISITKSIWNNFKRE